MAWKNAAISVVAGFLIGVLRNGTRPLPVIVTAPDLLSKLATVELTFATWNGLKEHWVRSSRHYTAMNISQSKLARTASR
ncbi:hypothetical protein VKT23_006501 [Stygiomarasmius scandens]|uniref:Uncharacterized protein n=1 Tax=Marasmiellus scandens TaxID=2682957 RepID=A0ABR1JMY1_9AGAR